MNARRKNRYVVQLQRSDGEISERAYEVYWRTDREDHATEAAQACAAEMTVFESPVLNGERVYTYAGLSAVLQEEPIAA